MPEDAFDERVVGYRLRPADQQLAELVRSGERRLQGVEQIVGGDPGERPGGVRALPRAARGRAPQPPGEVMES